MKADELYRSLQDAVGSGQTARVDSVLKNYSRALVTTIGREVDRIEMEIRWAARCAGRACCVAARGVGGLPAWRLLSGPC
jgi:hypothetical protein